MASEIGRGAQVILDGDARKAARGTLNTRLIDNIRGKDVLEDGPVSSDGLTPDGATRDGTAADDYTLEPGGTAGASSWNAGEVDALGTGLTLVSGTLSATATPTITTATAGANNKTGLLVPFYLFPNNPYSNTDLQRLLGLIRKYHDVPVIVVVNPASGPGSYDLVWATTIKLLKGAGAIVVGYVSTAYAVTPEATVKADVLAWNTIYAATPVDGIFFDEMPYDYGVADANLNLYARYYSYTYDHGYTLVIGNPGTNQQERWYSNLTADIIIMWENSTWPSEADVAGNYAGGHTDYSIEFNAVLVHSMATFNLATFATIRPYVKWIYVTDDLLSPNPWDALPTYLEAVFTALSDVTGGSIEAVTIGATTAAAGTFSTLIAGGSAAGKITLTANAITMASGQGLTASLGGNGTSLIIAGTGGTGTVASFNAVTGQNTIDFTGSAANLTKAARLNVLPGTRTYSGAFSNAGAAFSATGAAAGTPTGTDFPYYSFVTSSDVATNTGGNVGVQIQHNTNAVMTGGRTALFVKRTQVAKSGNAAAGIDPFYETVRFVADMSFDEGGTGTTLATAKGHQFAMASYARLASGATNIYANVGWEHDQYMPAGTSAARNVGFQIVHLGGSAVQGTATDAAIVLNDQGSVTGHWRDLIQVGDPGAYWPLDATNGTILRARIGNAFPATPLAAKDGINVLEAIFANKAFLTRGMAILADGSAQIGTGLISSAGATTSINTTYNRGLAEGATISGGALTAGGTAGWVVNDVLRDANNGVYYVSAVSGGVITQLTVYRSAYASGSPSTAVTLIADHGADGTGTVSITQTWTPGATLALQASGGGTTIGGTLGVTGVLTALTAAVDTNTTQAATTAYVIAQAASASPGTLGPATVGTSTRFARADHRHAFPAPFALTAGATINTDCSQSFVFTVTLGANATLANPTNIVSGAHYTWVVRQDPAVARTLSFGSVFKWANATAPTQTTTLSAYDVYSAFSPDGTNLFAVQSANFA